MKATRLYFQEAVRLPDNDLRSVVTGDKWKILRHEGGWLVAGMHNGEPARMWYPDSVISSAVLGPEEPAKGGRK